MVSEKLTTVPEKFRGEFGWVLPLAQVNGCFECTPMLVWRTCYSGVRPDWSVADVSAMLDEFEKAKMLFRFQADGKTYGFFVGIQKEGRLPKPSDRVKAAKQWQAGMVPEKQLASFLGVPVKKVREDYRDEVATNSRVGRDKVARKSPTGNGNGVGIGSGAGTGLGEGVGVGIGCGIGGGADSLPSPLANALPRISSSQDDNTNTNTQDQEIELEFLDESKIPDDYDEEEASRPKELMCLTGLTHRGYAQLFRMLMYENPHSDEAAIPKGWCDMWGKDFKELLGKVPHQTLLDVIMISQTTKNKPFYIRPKKLVDNLALLRTMVAELKGAAPTVRAKFRVMVRKLDQEGKWPVTA